MKPRAASVFTHLVALHVDTCSVESGRIGRQRPTGSPATVKWTHKEERQETGGVKGERTGIGYGVGLRGTSVSVSVCVCVVGLVFFCMHFTKRRCCRGRRCYHDRQQRRKKRRW